MPASGNKVDYAAVERIYGYLLDALHLDRNDPNMLDTPRRCAAFWREFLEYDAGNTATTFVHLQTDQMVILDNVRVYTLCAHHLLPFHVDLTMAYLTNGHVLGISKLARIAQRHAHKPQMQERLVTEIADELSALAATDHVAVMGRGVHMCMIMRGIKTEGTMITNIMRGHFREADSQARAELMLSIGRR